MKLLKKPKGKKILLFARDPGGANTVAPLTKPLKQQGYQVLLFGKDMALDKYLLFQLKGHNIAHYLSQITSLSIERFLGQIAPDLVITGTSAKDQTEKYFWQAANKLNIPAWAILDQWMSYAVRFSHSKLPQQILVMDQEAKLALAEEKIPKQKIIVTGHPYFEYLEKQVYPKYHQLKKRSAFVITYISEPLQETYFDSCSRFGYNEQTIFQTLFSLLKILALKQKIIFNVKIHPRENNNKYAFWQKQKLPQSFIFKIYDRINPWSLISSSDLICGMSSMLLLEACILKKPIMSIQIGLKTDNPFILAKRHLTDTIVDRDTLRKKMELAIINPKLFVCKFDYLPQAIDKILYQVKQKLYVTSGN